MNLDEIIFRKAYFLVQLFFLSSLTFAQDSLIIPDHIRGKVIPISKASDSLENKNFKELEALFKENTANRSKARIYAEYYLYLAKNSKDTTEIANAFNFLRKVSDSQTELKYIDSIIAITRNIKNKEYPAMAYLIKGSYFHLKNEYNEALENYLIAQKHVEDNSNPRLLLAIKNNMAALKKAVGGKKEALKIFLENLDFIKTQDTVSEYSRAYITALYNIADSYHRMSMPDSASKYVNKGLIKSNYHSEKYLYPTFLLLSGINNNLIGNPQNALDSLAKMENLIKDNFEGNVNERICYIQIAKALHKLNRENEAFKYLKKVDSMVKPDNYTLETRDAFELLINHYKKNGDLENQLEIMSKLIHMDTLFQSKNLNINSDISKKYDNAKLIKESNEIIGELRRDKKKNKISLIISIILITILSLFLIRYYRQQVIYKKRFSELMVESKVPLENIDKKKETFDTDLPADIINDILLKLGKFESSRGYLNTSIKLNSLAKQLDTNSSYLSKIINIHKGKNFANYVNDLRIDYCIEKLKTDKKFRLYAVKYIGEEVGFNSVQSFSRAFYRRTGIYPSYFIKNIQKS